MTVLELSNYCVDIQDFFDYVVLPAGRLAEKLWREKNERWLSKAKAGAT
jgi:hypothetical protein